MIIFSLQELLYLVAISGHTVPISLNMCLKLFLIFFLEEACCVSEQYTEVDLNKLVQG